MSVTTHETGLETLDTLEGIDALCVFVSVDERPLLGLAGYLDWRLCGRLSRVLEEGFFTGAGEDSLLLPTNGRIAASRVFVLGLGRSADLTAEKVEGALKNAAKVLTQAKVNAVGLELPGGQVLDEATRARVLKSAFLPGFKGGRVAVLGDKSLLKLVA